MKTAISIPDDLFEHAEHFAHEHGLSRSELYVTALRLYLESQQGLAITEQLDAIYADEPTNLDPALVKVQTSILPKEEW